MKNRDEFDKILFVISGLKSGEVWSRKYDEPIAHRLRDSVRRYLTIQGIGDTIKMSVEPDRKTLYVSKKEPSYVERLENMLRSVAFSTDDEDLFDRIMKLLEKP